MMIWEVSCLCSHIHNPFSPLENFSGVFSPFSGEVGQSFISQQLYLMHLNHANVLKMGQSVYGAVYIIIHQMKISPFYTYILAHMVQMDIIEPRTLGQTTVHVLFTVERSWSAPTKPNTRTQKSAFGRPVEQTEDLLQDLRQHLHHCAIPKRTKQVYMNFYITSQ